MTFITEVLFWVAGILWFRLSGIEMIHRSIAFSPVQSSNNYYLPCNLAQDFLGFDGKQESESAKIKELGSQTGKLELYIVLRCAVARGGAHARDYWPWSDIALSWDSSIYSSTIFSALLWLSSQIRAASKSHGVCKGFIVLFVKCNWRIKCSLLCVCITTFVLR